MTVAPPAAHPYSPFPPPGPRSCLAASLLRRAVRAWDAFLRRRLDIFEYSSDPRVLLRLQFARASRPVLLADGTRVKPGERVAVMHFHNERIPTFSRSGADLSWGLDFARSLWVSLRELQHYLSSRPELRDIRYAWAHVGFVEEKDLGRTASLAAKFGLEFVSEPPPGSRFWRPAFWENIGGWIMVWTFNPASLKRKRFRHLLNAHIRISREALDRVYGRPGGAESRERRPQQPLNACRTPDAR